MRTNIVQIFSIQASDRAKNIKPYFVNAKSKQLQEVVFPRGNRKVLKHPERIFWMTEEEYKSVQVIQAKINALRSLYEKQLLLTEELFVSTLMEKCDK